MADSEDEEEGRQPPERFLRPGYLTTAGSDELRDRAERVLEDHARTSKEHDDRGKDSS